MSKKKILIFIDWFLPGYKAGGPIQSIANLVSQMGSELDFSIVTSNKDLGESEPYPNLEYNKWLFRENYRVMYLDEAHQHIKQYKALMAERDYDSIYFNSMFSVRFTLLPLWAARDKSSKIILAPRGMLGNGALNIKKRKKQLFLILLKLSGIAKKIIWHVTADMEASEIKYHFGEETRVIVAPNFSAPGLEKTPPKTKVPNELKLFFLSRIAEKKNLNVALDFLLKVNRKYKIGFTIIGPVDEVNYWQECQQIIDKLPAHVKVNYTGPVHNKELPKFLGDQHFMLLPTMHENFGHVIIEAWQNGCPVIISDQTPWHNLEEKQAGWDIPLSQPEKFVDAIETAVAMSQETYNKWSAAAYNHAKNFCSNSQILESNKKLFEG